MFVTKRCRDKWNTFYVPHTFSASLIVFEIFKPNWHFACSAFCKQQWSPHTWRFVSLVALVIIKQSFLLPEFVGLHVYKYCNMLGYWRCCSVCYTSLFTTSLVVTTISFYNVLGPSDVVARSVPGSSALILGSPWIWSLVASLISVLWSVLPWSLFFCLTCLYSAAPEIGCLRPRKKTPSPAVFFPVLALLQFLNNSVA
jgi:hypothetical protein